MRRMFLAIAAGFTLLSAISLSPNQAQAGALPVPAGIQAALEDSSMIQDVAYVCRRVWRCGPYGCGWRRFCEYTRPVYRPYYPAVRPYRYYHRW